MATKKRNTQHMINMMEGIAEDKIERHVDKHEGIYVHIKKKTLQGILALIPAVIPLLLCFFVIVSLATFESQRYIQVGDESITLDFMSSVEPDHEEFSGATHINIPIAWMTLFTVILLVSLGVGTLASVLLIFAVATHFFNGKD